MAGSLRLGAGFHLSGNSGSRLRQSIDGRLSEYLGPDGLVWGLSRGVRTDRLWVWDVGSREAAQVKQWQRNGMSWPTDHRRPIRNAIYENPYALPKQGVNGATKDRYREWLVEMMDDA
jgi:hypothetical protein